jgi:hypothetical protein
MATPKSSSPSKFQTEVQSMMSGLNTNMPSTLRTMLIGGSSMTIPQVIAKFQAILDMLNAVTLAKTAYQHAIATRKGELVADHAFYSNVVAFLKNAFGATDQTTLSGFGILPPKTRAKPTTTTRAIATAKAAATRKARGTMGKKQKAAITTTPAPTVQVLGADGQPLGSTAAPVAPVAPPAPAPVAPPAPAAAPPHA